MTKIVVREATLKDIPGIAKLTKSSTLNYNPADTLTTMEPDVALQRARGLLTDTDCITYVALVDEKIIGTGYLTTTGHISNPYISTPVKGVGEALLKARLKKAEEMEIVQVSMSPTDPKMRKLIQKHGFILPSRLSPLWFKGLKIPKTYGKIKV